MKRFRVIVKLKPLIVFFLIILLPACSKEDDKPALDYSKIYLVKGSVLETHKPHNYNATLYDIYEYDTSGRIIYHRYTTPGSDDIYFYKYVSPSEIYKIHSNGYDIPDTIFMELNEMGLVVCEHEPKYKIIARFKYNDEGYCIYDLRGVYVTDTSDIPWPNEHTYTIIDGNYNRAHYDDKVNTLGYANFGMSFYGKSSKNLEKSVYSDEFDSIQRVVKRYNKDVTIQYTYVSGEL